MSIDKDIDFIAKHYRKGLFSVEPALFKVRGIRKRIWTFPKIAAVSSIIIAVGATAAILITNSYYSQDNETQVPVIEKASPALVSRVIDFDNTPLPMVIDRINKVYDVEVINLPANADEYYLSLHYEGNAKELVETINEILGTEMKIKE